MSRIRLAEVSRAVGLAVPVAFVMIGVFSQTFNDLVNQISVFWEYFLVGLVAGVLIRAWWSCALVPALLLGTMVAVAIARDDLAAGAGSEIDWPIGLILALVFNLILPSGIGAAIGSLVGYLGNAEESFRP